MLCLDGGGEHLRLRWVEETCPTVGAVLFTACVRILCIVDPVSG